ncbi:MAG: MFS transporter [Chloroflexota bacterium]|nr:MFS transporter [Chloroflexota bacterium]
MPDITAVFLRWMGMRAVLHRGYWLVTSLYLVVDAQLSAFQLVFLGTAQGIISLVVEVPAGVVADTISRKWALVIAHAFVGISMVITGLVTSFPALVGTQMLWGVGWAFASGADIAWVTDELGRPDRIARVLTASARWEVVGSAVGLLGFGLLALAIGRGPAMVVAGVAMVVLGLYVISRFTEHGFTPTRARRWQQSTTILRRGVALARRDREILLVLVATVLINGAAEAYGRLYPRQLVELGFPGQSDPIVWFTGLGIIAFAIGALALRIVEARIDGVGVARRVYAAACFIGAIGLIALACAPGYLVGSAGVLLVGGITLTVTRAVGVIWVNRRTTSDVRATMQSMLAQAEYGGEILCGVALGALAKSTSIPVAFACSAALIAGAGVMVVQSRTRGHGAQ